MNFIPICLYNFSVIELNLSSNYISSLPHDFKQLVSLKYLDLSNNRLTVLGTGILYLRELIKLDISHNSISELNNFNYFKKMQYLICHHNNIQILDLYSMESLKVLDANTNK